MRLLMRRFRPATKPFHIDRVREFMAGWSTAFGKVRTNRQRKVSALTRQMPPVARGAHRKHVVVGQIGVGRAIVGIDDRMGVHVRQMACRRRAVDRMGSVLGGVDKVGGRSVDGNERLRHSQPKR